MQGATGTLDDQTGLRVRPADGAAELKAALAVRRAVFVTEQGGPAGDEPDADDARSVHFVVEADSGVVGTARLVPVSPGVARIGRVCLLPGARGRGWGERLLAAVIEEARTAGLCELVLSAQAPAVAFYERFGFQVEGDPFVEAGIPHRGMRMRLER
jgi:predicted GNAT family N-acyltransferase